MKDNDGRKLSHEALQQIRITAVKQVEAGESPEDVIKAIGFERVCIYRWLSAYRSGGIEALKAKKLSGRPRLLTPKQLKKLYAAIANEDPRQYKFPFALWTVAIIREVILKVFKVRMSEVSVWRTLKKLGLSPQRPLRRAYQQDPEAVKRFIEKEYPVIRKRAKRCRATIYFGDEAAIRSDYHSGTTWAPKGNTPIVTTTGARFSINMISAISAKGKLRFMVTEKNLKVDIFIAFLKRLMIGEIKPVFLIVDGHPVHKAKKVKEFIRSTKGKIELFYLPGYSPELNPDEYVWNHVKHHTVGKMYITGPDQLKKLVISALHRLAHVPGLLIAFFKMRDLLFYVNYTE
jgi:transposase